MSRPLGNVEKLLDENTQLREAAEAALWYLESGTRQAPAATPETIADILRQALHTTIQHNWTNDQ